MSTVIQQFGFLNTSVWHLTKNPTLTLFLKDNSEARLIKRSNNSFLPGYKFSEFNPELARRIIKYWSEPGDTIYDSFPGRGTRGSVAFSLQRSYIGTEVSYSVFREVSKAYGFLCTSQLNPNPCHRLDLSIFHDDGCKRHHYIFDESIDMIFTCPPYWNLEKYESCTGQLSDCKSYEEFLEKIEDCVKECYRVLKPGKFSVWVVADFRRKKFYCFHGDLINLHLKNGFLLWDVVINVLNSPFVSFKAQFNADMRYTSKTHEYVIVFKKPDREVGKNVNEKTGNKIL